MKKELFQTKVLTDKNLANMISEDERNVYQVFCCALAKKAKI